MNTPTLQEIIDASGKHPKRIRNVYLYGSRVYGTAKERSDWDIIVVCPSLQEHEELHKGSLNIHIITPDIFKNRLMFQHDITMLECIFAPDFARIQEVENYDYKINRGKLLKSIMTQSARTWKHAKYKYNEGDIYRGQKSGFHAIKTLDFGAQLCETGTIDFARNNDLYEQIMNEDILTWDGFKAKYLPLKEQYEQRVVKLSEG